MIVLYSGLSTQICYSYCSENNLPFADIKYRDNFNNSEVESFLDLITDERCFDGRYSTGDWRYSVLPSLIEPYPDIVMGCYRDPYQTCPDGSEGPICQPSLFIHCGSCNGSSSKPTGIKIMPVPYCYGKRAQYTCYDSYQDKRYRCKRMYQLEEPPPQPCEITNDPVPKEGNPCNPTNGDKTQTETDYASTNGTLRVQRHYESRGSSDGFKALGPGWRHNYTRRIDGYGVPNLPNNLKKSPFYNVPRSACTTGWNHLKNEIFRGFLANATPIYNNGVCEIWNDGELAVVLPIHNTVDGRKNVGTSSLIRSINRPMGSATTFLFQSNQWQPLQPSRVALEQNGTDWAFTTSSGAVETFDNEGKLLTITSSTSQLTSFTYDTEGRLATATDHFGSTLIYHYDEAGLLNTITTPDGDLDYGYDAEGRLASVTYPDSSQRHYHYEDTNFPHHLTGITDENNQRYATWAYDSEGRAILSEHAGGAEKVEFTYSNDGTTTVSDSAGAERIYHFVANRGGMKVSHIVGDRCNTCLNGGINAYTYDGNGFIASKTDWNDNVTTFTRDDQGRELSRTDASGTPEARIVTTSWDTVLNKPLMITEPDQITEYTYDASGRILNQQQRPHP